MKFSDYFKVVCIVMLLATLTNVSCASANYSEKLFAKTETADLNNQRWQEDKRQQPGKDKKDQPQDKRTTVKEVPKAKPKLRPENVDEKRETKRPTGKGKK